KSTPDSMNEIAADPQFFTQAANAPVSRLLRPPIEGRFQHLLNPIVSVVTRLAAARRIRQSRQPIGNESASPFRHRLFTGRVSFCDLITGVTTGTIQHNPGSEMQAGRGLAASTPTLQLRFFRLAQYNLCCPSAHAVTPTMELTI